MPNIAQKLQKMFPFLPMASGIGRFYLFGSAQGRSAEYHAEIAENVSVSPDGVGYRAFSRLLFCARAQCRISRRNCRKCFRSPPDGVGYRTVLPLWFCARAQCRISHGIYRKIHRQSGMPSACEVTIRPTGTKENSLLVRSSQVEQSSPFQRDSPYLIALTPSASATCAA